MARAIRNLAAVAFSACGLASLLLLLAMSLLEGDRRQTSCAVGKLPSQVEAVQRLVECHIRQQRQQFAALNRTLRLLRLNSSDWLQPGCRRNSSGRPGQLLAPLFSTAALAQQSSSVAEFLRFANDTFASDTSVNQSWTPRTERKLRRYTDYLRRTSAIRDLYETLSNNGLLPAGQQFGQFVDSTLHQLWFQMYGRRRRQQQRGFTNSCGFEHVFVGEVRGQSVLGFHNWLSFLAGEEAGSLRYRGYYGLQVAPLPVVSLCFDWRNRTKTVTSLLLGVQPEFELLLFTAAHLLKPKGVTKLLFPGNQRLYVQSFAEAFANCTVHSAFALQLPDRRSRSRRSPPA